MQTSIIKTVVKHVAVIASGAVFLASAWQAQAVEPALAVTKALYRAAADERQFDAVVEAVNKATVSAETSGRIVDIMYDVDDYVVKGSVLVRFKGTEQRAEAGASEALLREAQARLDEASAEYDRAKELFDRKLVAKSVLDTATASRSSARERVDAARHRVQQTQELIGYTEVRAPFSGIVTKRHVEIGEMATAGQPLMSGFSLDKLRVVATVPQSSMEAIRRNNQVRIIVPGQTPRVVTPSKVTFFPYADANTHAIKVRLDLPAGLKDVLPGMMVKAAFLAGSEQRMSLPQSAIARRSEVTAVYTVDNAGRVSMRQVRLGKSLDDGQVVIISGLEQGESVALDAVKAAIRVKQQRAGSKP